MGESREREKSHFKGKGKGDKESLMASQQGS